MPEVTETHLPGVGVRHEFTTSDGERVGVVSHRGGRRELVVYDQDDLDACSAILHLAPDDTRTLAELLGATQVSEALTAVQQRLEGLAIAWVRIDRGSAFDGATIADGRFRTRTGSSIVAVVRNESTVPAPGPDFQFEAGDVVVVIGTPEGLAQVRAQITE